MRSQPGGRTGGPSSGRVLAPVQGYAMNVPTFVMVSAFTVTLSSRRRMRVRRDGNGGASSGLRLTS